MVFTWEKNFLLTNFDVQIDQHSPVQKLYETKEFLSYDLAPEFFLEKKYTQKSNIWDLGILIH